MGTILINFTSDQSKMRRLTEVKVITVPIFVPNKYVKNVQK